MTLQLIVIAFLSLAAFAQQSTLSTLTGTLERIAGNELQIKTGEQTVTVYADDWTRVYVNDGAEEFGTIGGFTVRALPLNVEYQSTVRCRQDSPGRLIAVSIRLRVKAVAFRAGVTKMTPGGFEALADGDGKKAVSVGQNTVFNIPRTWFAAGQDVGVVGLDLGNGNVAARRVTVYNTDLRIM